MEQKNLIVEIKKVKLNKSLILQMEMVGIPKYGEFDVLGYVIIGDNKWTIIYKVGNYYRGEYISNVNVTKNTDGTRNIQVTTHNRGILNYLPQKNEDDVDKLIEHLNSYKIKTQKAGQIYY